MATSAKNFPTKQERRAADNIAFCKNVAGQSNFN